MLAARIIEDTIPSSGERLPMLAEGFAYTSYPILSPWCTKTIYQKPWQHPEKSSKYLANEECGCRVVMKKKMAVRYPASG